MTGWFPICGDCASPEHSTFPGDPELACAKCAVPKKELMFLKAEREEALELLKAAYLGKTALAPLSARSWHDRTRSLLKRCGWL